MGEPGGRVQNLKPFKKGHKSTGGRPKGSISMTSVMQKLIDKKFTKKNPDTGKRETKSMREWIVLAALDKAQRGDIKAIDMVMDRLDGKVATTVNVNTSEIEAVQEVMRQMDKEVALLDKGND